MMAWGQRRRRPSPAGRGESISEISPRGLPKQGQNFLATGLEGPSRQLDGRDGAS